MANEIYHRSNWGNAVNNNAWGDVYEKFDATNEIYIRSDYYENSNETDKLMAAINPKPSILLTPTAYDNGSLHSVKPVDVLGSEKITNGDFSDGSTGWDIESTWTIANNMANGNGANGSAEELLISYVIPAGLYKVVFEVKNYVSGNVRAFLEGLIDTSISANGVYTFYQTTTSDRKLKFRGTDFYGSIDNVSVKEVIDADFDFTRGSSATRVNEKGLIEDVQILSGNLVQNGDFSQIGSELIPDGNFTNQAAVDYWSIADTGGVERATASLENGFMRLTYDIANGSALVRSGIVTSGKSYKVTFRAKGTANSNFHSIGDNINIPSNPQYVVLNPTLTNDWQNYEFYVPVSSTTFRLYLTSAQIGDTLDITNISVKEVGQNWTFGTGWSMGDGKAVFDGFSNVSLQQDGIVANNKKYRLTYTILDYVQGGVKWRFGLSSNLTPVRSANGTYVEEITATGSDFRAVTDGATELSIDNISVIEITEDTNIPRIDYSNGEASILLEGESTNLLGYSEDFSDSSWIKTHLSILSNSIISPGGNLKANKLIPNTTSGQHKIDITKTVTNGSTVSLSAFVKKGEYNFCCLYEVTSSKGRFFDLSNGTQGGTFVGTPTTSNIESYNNDWYRISISTTVLSTSARYILYVCDTISNTSFAGNNTKGVYVWGAQLEEQSFASSYIPSLNGTPTTRLAESLTGAGSSDLINSEQGTLYAEIAALSDDGTNRRISITDGTNSNRINISYAASSNHIQSFGFVNGSLQFNLTSQITPSTESFNKIAVKFKENDVALWFNGVEIATDNSVNTWANNTLNDLSFANNPSSNAEAFYGNVKCVAVFKEALSDTELQNLTTI